MESAIGHLEESVSIYYFLRERLIRDSNDDVTVAVLSVREMLNVLLGCRIYFCLLVPQVQKADGKLDMIAWQIDEFEKAFEDPEDEVGVCFSAFISRDYEITFELCSF